MSGKRIPTTQIDSGYKFTNDRGMSVIKDGIKASTSDAERLAKPEWLRMRVQSSPKFDAVRSIVHEHGLATVCEEAKCPNMGECWGEGTATFMILGNICTRSCGFCHVITGKPHEVDVFEPGRVANSVKLMGVKHAVITSVDRDDLPDGGSEIWAQTVRAIRHQSPGTTLETLIPDFAGKWENLQRIIQVAEVSVFRPKKIRFILVEFLRMTCYGRKSNIIPSNIEDLRI